LRELVAMAEARSRERWNHTAAVLALLANCHRDPRRHRAYIPADFLPQEPRRAAKPLPDLSILKAVFVNRRTPEVTQ
jgi:hypothetical protein